MVDFCDPGPAPRFGCRRLERSELLARQCGRSCSKLSMVSMRYGVNIAMTCALVWVAPMRRSIAWSLALAADPFDPERLASHRRQGEGGTQDLPSSLAHCAVDRQHGRSALHANDLFERVYDVDEIALCFHDSVDVLVCRRRFIDHARIFAALDALGCELVVVQAEAFLCRRARHHSAGAVAAALECFGVAFAAHDV